MMAKKIIHACSIKKAIKVTEDAVFFFVLKLPYTYVHFFSLNGRCENFRKLIQFIDGKLNE